MFADKLFLGNILTMEAGRPIQEAMTVKDGKVQFVGARSMAETLCGSSTEIVDFSGRYIYPGVTEGHCHPDMAGMRLKLQADLTPGVTMTEYVQLMDAFIKANPGMSEYCGAGWSERECLPTAAMLDAICPDTPVLLNSIDGHSMWMNSVAMREHGIDGASVEKWGTEVVHVDEEGNPTGYVSEGPVFDITQSIKYTEEDKDRSFLAWQDFAFSHGLTSCLHAGVTLDVCETYNRLIKAGKWKLRTYGVYWIRETSDDYIAEVRAAKELAQCFNNEYFQIIGIKIFADGVVEAGTAWLTEPYSDKPESTGVKRMCDHDRVAALYKEAMKEGFLVHCHTIGDGAVKFALDCIEDVQRELGDYTSRHALAHLQLLRPQDIKRMADLRVIPVVAPLWTPKLEESYQLDEIHLGKERVARQLPLKSFEDVGAHTVFHTDYPVSTSMNVPRSMYTAVLRTTPELGPDGVHNPAECLDRWQSLAALTCNAAFSVKQEGNLGVLVPGAVANMVVFDKDFLNDDIEEVANAQLLATLIDGETVYSA